MKDVEDTDIKKKLDEHDLNALKCMETAKTIQKTDTVKLYQVQKDQALEEKGIYQRNVYKHAADDNFNLNDDFKVGVAPKPQGGEAGNDNNMTIGLNGTMGIGGAI